jgi:hypothetical protein
VSREPCHTTHGRNALCTSPNKPTRPATNRAKPKRGYHIFWPFNPDPEEPFVNPPPVAPRSRRTSMVKEGKPQVDYVQGALKEDMMSELEVRLETPSQPCVSPRLSCPLPASICFLYVHICAPCRPLHSACERSARTKSSKRPNLNCS